MVFRGGGAVTFAVENGKLKKYKFLASDFHVLPKEFIKSMGESTAQFDTENSLFLYNGQILKKKR